jgi:hypothetical protein
MAYRDFGGDLGPGNFLPSTEVYHLAPALGSVAVRGAAVLDLEGVVDRPATVVVAGDSVASARAEALELYRAARDPRLSKSESADLLWLTLAGDKGPSGLRLARGLRALRKLQETGDNNEEGEL